MTETLVEGGGSPLKDAEVFTMPTEEALRQFELYKVAVERSRGAADIAMMKTYKALSEGKGVLNLPNVMLKAGTHDNARGHGRPKLAVMRADQGFAYWRRDGTGGFFSAERDRWLRRNTKTAQLARLQFHFREGTFPALDHMERSTSHYYQICRAPVPPIPPEYRPADAYSKYCILWEVDEGGWTTVETPRAPGDPILLKPTGAPGIYVIMAHWDLKPVEQMILNALYGN